MRITLFSGYSLSTLVYVFQFIIYFFNNIQDRICSIEGKKILSWKSSESLLLKNAPSDVDPTQCGAVGFAVARVEKRKRTRCVT